MFVLYSDPARLECPVRTVLCAPHPTLGEIGTTRRYSFGPISNDAIAFIGMQAGGPTRTPVLLPSLPGVGFPIRLLFDELARRICPPDYRDRCEQHSIEALAHQRVRYGRSGRLTVCHAYPLEKPRWRSHPVVSA